MGTPESTGDNEDVMEAIFERNRQYKEKKAKELQSAKDARPEWKAPFDLAKLKEYYSPSHGSVFSDLPVTEEMIREFEEAYFLKYPETRNMQELADKLLKEDYGDIG